MSTLRVNEVQDSTGKIILKNSGGILQVIQTYLDTPTTQSITAQTYTDISGMSASITPSSTSSKILVHARWFGESSATNEDTGFGLRRNGTIIGAPVTPGLRAAVMTTASLNYFNDNSSTPESAQLWYLDSPSSTSSVTYTMWYSNNSSVTLATNRTITDTNTFNFERGTCAMILMEVSA